MPTGSMALTGNEAISQGYKKHPLWLANRSHSSGTLKKGAIFCGGKNMELLKAPECISCYF